MRLVTKVAVVLVGVLVLGGPAAAQQYPPDEPTCGISDTVVVPGQAITITCDGWQPGSEVTATFFSHPVVLGSDTANSQGEVSITGTIPGDAEPGDHVIRVEGIADDGEPAVVEIGVTVAGAGAAAGDGAAQVAVTGRNVTVGFMILAGLIVGGTVALLIGRRRASTTR
ncbi:MAG TPA: hypothetical protein VG709_08295 [Actinomycetota bacterium]|nr:hypothetical protein [Actinomycetota bacterium]